MMYEKYERKIRKIANDKNTIIRFKILIITTFSLCLALAATLLSIKGIIVSDFDYKLEVIYGDEITVSGLKSLNVCSGKR